MQYQAIAFDLDGTLLSPNATILASSKEAIEKARAKGIKVFFVTGRHHTAVRPYYAEIDLDTPVVCCNGTYLYDFKQEKVLAGNELVLIAPAKSAVNSVDIAKGEWIKGLKDSYLSVGDPAHVPAGQYAEESLTKLNLWDQVKDKLARAKDVRGALALVERAEAPYGIVYSTDAKVSSSVKTVGVFPKDSYKPVEYPVAILKDHDNADTRDFLNYLESSAAKKIFVEYGFSVK